MFKSKLTTQLCETRKEYKKNLYSCQLDYNDVISKAKAISVLISSADEFSINFVDTNGANTMWTELRKESLTLERNIKYLEYNLECIDEWIDAIRKGIPLYILIPVSEIGTNVSLSAYNGNDGQCLPVYLSKATAKRIISGDNTMTVQEIR